MVIPQAINVQSIFPLLQLQVLQPSEEGKLSPLARAEQAFAIEDLGVF